TTTPPDTPPGAAMSPAPPPRGSARGGVRTGAVPFGLVTASSRESRPTTDDDRRGTRRMCGLLGLLTPDGSARAAESRVLDAMGCQRHRGPDEVGTWADADLAFGLNRLSIIDIAHSHQPRRWGHPEQPDRYALTFTGEIYDYLELRSKLERDHGVEFATDGDGEPILAAFHHRGAAAVRDLRGMFAF